MEQKENWWIKEIEKELFDKFGVEDQETGLLGMVRERNYKDRNIKEDKDRSIKEDKRINVFSMRNYMMNKVKLE